MGFPVYIKLYTIHINVYKKPHHTKAKANVKHAQKRAEGNIKESYARYSG